jgi:predicted RNA-binding protein
MSNWIVVGSHENMEIARERGFDMFGFKSSRRRESATMEPGDRLIFYLIGIMKFGGMVEVTGQAYEDHSPVFKTEKKPNEDYPWRIATKPVTVLDESQFLDVKEYADKLDLTRARGEYWRLAFQGNLHKISDADYKLLAHDIEAAAKKKAVKA